MTATIPSTIFVPVTVRHRGEPTAAIHEITLPGVPVAGGLAVTPAIRWGTYTGGWSVTHIGSGYTIGSTRGACWACIHVAVDVLDGIDWTRDQDSILADPAARAAAVPYNAIIDGCGCGCVDFE